MPKVEGGGTIRLPQGKPRDLRQESICYVLFHTDSLQKRFRNTSHGDFSVPEAVIFPCLPRVRSVKPSARKIGGWSGGSRDQKQES